MSERTLRRWKKAIDDGKADDVDFARQHGHCNTALLMAYVRGGKKEAQTLFPAWPDDTCATYYPELPQKAENRFHFLWETTEDRRPNPLKKRSAAELAVEFPNVAIAVATPRRRRWRRGLLMGPLLK